MVNSIQNLANTPQIYPCLPSLRHAKDDPIFLFMSILSSKNMIIKTKNDDFFYNTSNDCLQRFF